MDGVVVARGLRVLSDLIHAESDHALHPLHERITKSVRDRQICEPSAPVVWASKVRKRTPRRLYRTPDLPPFTELVCLPRDAYYASGELVPLLDDNDQPNQELVGRICADQIVPYPPGIPVLVPGQLITDNIVEFLIRYLRVQSKVELHGVVYQGYFPSIRVLTAAERNRLTSLRGAQLARIAA